MGPRLDKTKQELYRAGVWTRAEAKRDIKDFFRYWAVELIVLVVLNIRVDHIVEHVAGMIRGH